MPCHVGVYVVLRTLGIGHCLPLGHSTTVFCTCIPEQNYEFQVIFDWLSLWIFVYFHAASIFT